MSFKTLTNQALIALLLVISLVGVPIMNAQTRNTNPTPPNPVQTLNQTTLAAAVTAASNFNIISVTSATGFAAGYRVVVISPNQVEAMDVLSVSSTNITVVRGVGGTSRYAHNSGDTVYVQRPALFFANGPKVPCVSSTTSTGATALVTSTTTPTPWVDLNAGDVWFCAQTSWVRIIRSGVSVGDAGGNRILAYTAAGAIMPVPGIHNIGTSGALAMTIAPPTKDLDGDILVVAASTAQAHTLTYTAGFRQDTTSSDICTFGGAIGDNIVFYATGGVWMLISTRNVTCA